jgi:hypothetical protein
MSVLTRLSTLGLLVLITGTLSAAYEFNESVPGQLDVLHNGKIVARYMHAFDRSTDERAHETYKPYLHVFDASGETPITKGPGGQYTHHRGIFLGYSKLGFDGQRFDLWHMKGVQQVHQKFLQQEAGDDKAVFTSLVHWNDKEGKPILKEERTFTITDGPDGGYAMIEMTSKLQAERGDVELAGDPEHAGAQFRPANEVDRKKTIYYFPGENADPRKDKDYNWVGETYTLNGQQYSVVILNNPENPKGTVFSAYRDYGRFGAYPKATLEQGKTLTLNYKWLIKEGEMFSPNTIHITWIDNYSDVDEPTPEVTVRPVSR